MPDAFTRGPAMIVKDADLHLSLAAFGPDALRQLQDVLTSPESSRNAPLRAMRDVGR